MKNTISDVTLYMSRLSSKKERKKQNNCMCLGACRIIYDYEWSSRMHIYGL